MQAIQAGYRAWCRRLTFASPYRCGTALDWSLRDVTSFPHFALVHPGIERT
jgi:hypothetical protein